MLSIIEPHSEILSRYADRNQGTLWQVVKAYRANLRQGTVGVKTRSMVKSTGKKPFKQKKTGSARRGSFVAPLHVGGGVAHGPQARDYRTSIPTSMSKVALGIALASRLKTGLVYTGTLDFPNGKTKDAAQYLKQIKEFSGKKILVCLDKPSTQTIRALRNIRGVQLVCPEQITAFALVQNKCMVTSMEAFKVLESRLLNE